ncbi:hypothetical protein N7474_006988 [Penicillium riverlandense]|uniref:uncharacterized protein n=1 Tax=Penicillium riverlandense TaxID=1903569 RepID=UPI00254778B4|nr:uncharacterized protein N7474_006988 [Penicillium riverlandense]KAJ5815211.1 hypothetical protein N7474_006988 [Penicillium riverlandense]
MEYEDFSRPFHFIATGRFIAIHYNGSDFELHRTIQTTCSTYTGNNSSDGVTFELSVHNGKTRIVSDDGMFMTVIMPTGCAEYLKEECGQHTASTRCPRCERNYTIGFVSEPRDCITLVSRGLPSMFVFHDGVFYYYFGALNGSYAELERVERIEDASLFQFVGFLS